jgi:hypothetical protein
MNRKEYERKRSCYNKGNIPEFPWRDWGKPVVPSFWIVPNGSNELCRYASTCGACNFKYFQRFYMENTYVDYEWNVKDVERRSHDLIWGTDVWDFRGSTEINHEKLQSRKRVSAQIFKPQTSRVQNRNANYSTVTFGANLIRPRPCHSSGA